MASALSGGQTDKNGSSKWVSQWSDFINRLHKQTLILDCPECGSDIKLTRADVGAGGITIHCAACHDYLTHRTPRQFLHDLDAAGIPSRRPTDE